MRQNRNFKIDAPRGYISTSTTNIGDDIQSIAAKRFLKANSVAIEREFISEFQFPHKIKTVVSGWFLHTKDSSWNLVKFPPQKSWPPSTSIDPFFISIHFTPPLFSTLFSEENIDYLKNFQPIGARDLFTMEQLRQKGVESYFSGCLTLTLQNSFKQRNEIIYLVDLDEESINYVKSNVNSPVVIVNHDKMLLQFMNNKHREQYAHYFLNLYRQAKGVITTRLHAALPCLAFQTPVLMLTSLKKNSLLDYRFYGLTEHLFTSSQEELVKGEIDYNFDRPPSNKTTYLPLREKLITAMEQWVKEL